MILINLVQLVSNGKLYYSIFLLFWILYLPYFYWLKIAVNFLFYYSNEFFKLKLYFFKISLYINIIGVFNFVFFVAYIFRQVFIGSKLNDNFFLYVAIIQFACVLSFFYSSYFISKLIATIELKRKVNLIDISDYFAKLAFPPLALWIIQTKIKKIHFKNDPAPQRVPVKSSAHQRSEL